jgi:hypothetical protein
MAVITTVELCHYELVSSEPENRFIMERVGKVGETDRSFDREFWQRQGPEAIFAAAWEMAVEAWRWKNQCDGEPEFQRSVESLKSLRG